MHSHQHSHILSYGMVWTVRFVIRCGSYIHTWWVCCSNTWFYCDNIMVFQGRCAHWNEILCVGAKKNPIQNRWWHRQWRMWIQSCLSRPLRSMWLFFNAFTPAFFFLSIKSTRTKGLLVFSHPSPPPLPCLITSSSTQTHADSSALFPPPRLSLMFLPPPLQRVP